jgi:hypothetical protein
LFTKKVCKAAKAARMGFQKPAEIVITNSFQKPFNVATRGFQQLFGDNTGGFWQNRQN